MFKDEKRQSNATNAQAAELTIAQAKRNFRNACAVYEPLAPVRRHPFVAPALAMLAGFTMVRLMKPVTGVALLPFALQAFQIGMKIFKNFHKK